MNTNKIYNVKNRSSSVVVYNIPEDGIRREFAPGETKRITFEELQKLSYQPGGRELMANFLQIKSEGIVQTLNIPAQPEYYMTEQQIIDLLKTGSQAAFLDCLDYAPVGVIDLIKKFAVSLPLTDYEKRQALKAKTGFDVDEAIKNIANSRYTFEEITEDRKTKNGDVVDINFVGSVDGVEFEGGKADNYPLELGSGAFIPGFEDQLIGKSKGDDVDVNVEFPKDYGHEKLAGKKALFKVKINTIKEKKVPAIDDKFAVDLKRKDLADLKVYVKELLEQNYETSSKHLMKDEVLDKLAEEKIDVPESLINQEVDFMFAQYKQANPNEKMDEKAEAKKKDELRKQATSRVKLGLILADLGKKNEIKIDQNEIQNAIMQEAMRYPNQAQQVFEYYTKNAQATEAIKAGIFEDKVLDVILSKVKVKEKEVSASDLMKVRK